MQIKDLTIISVFTAILVVQSLAFSSIPYLQITFLLIFLFAKVLGTKKMAFVILFFITINNLIFGFVLPHQFIIMYFGYMLGPFVLNTIFKKTTNPFILATLSLVISIIYIVTLDFSWWLVFPTDFNGLLIFIGGGLVYAIPTFVSSFLSVLLLYSPLEKIISELYKNIVYNIE